MSRMNGRKSTAWLTCGSISSRTWLWKWISRMEQSSSQTEVLWGALEKITKYSPGWMVCVRLSTEKFSVPRRQIKSSIVRCRWVGQRYPAGKVCKNALSRSFLAFGGECQLSAEAIKIPPNGMISNCLHEILCCIIAKKEKEYSKNKSNMLFPVWRKKLKIE